jgi:hypothetical protein
MIRSGRYSVWFRTPTGEGAGVVELGPNGKLAGGDASYRYSGQWEQEGDRFTAKLTSKRFAPGPSVFGMDEVDIVVEGRSNEGVTASCKGFAKQAPGVSLEVTLVRMSND